MAFGSIAHRVLCEFGNDGEINACEDAEEIEHFLCGKVRTIVPERFGESPPVAVRVQMARLEQRLRSFARLQARCAADGWRIKHCEREFKGEVALDIPGQPPMPLRGAIDRIDFNDRTGQCRIIDYKTGDTAHSPHKAHHNCERLPKDGQPIEWQDLQLPLYHYLVTRCQPVIDGDIQLAYICLPRQSDGAKLCPALWDQTHLDHALETARDVVRCIRAGEFRLNLELDDQFDEFARICRTSAFMEFEPAEADA
jgi:hypothetical protein